MNTASYKVVKLTNGEEVICQLSDEIINDEYQLNCPLKMEVLVFDIADDISYRERRNFTLNHFSERINIYNEQQFNYEISKVKLK